MSDSTGIDRQKVIDAFNAFAKRHGNENAVLDVNPSEVARHRNVYRDYVSKSIVLRCLRPMRNDVLVDFGCGVGRLSRFLAPRVTRVEGLDKSPEMVRVARELTTGFDNIRYNLLEGDSFPVESESATKFFSFWVMQHVDNEEALSVLREAKRVLKPGGLVVLCEQVKPQAAGSDGTHHMRTPNDYIDLGTRAGLTFVSERRVFRFPSYGMNLWQKFTWLPKAALPLLAAVERWTVNRKPATIGYSTNAFVFRKI